jgi:hypothetical protein
MEDGRMVYVRGTLLGLALFSAWIAAIAAIGLAAYYIEYWLWAVFPAAFIAFGITLAKDRAATPLRKAK